MSQVQVLHMETVQNRCEFKFFRFFLTHSICAKLSKLGLSVYGFTDTQVQGFCHTRQQLEI